MITKNVWDLIMHYKWKTELDEIHDLLEHCIEWKILCDNNNCPGHYCDRGHGNKRRQYYKTVTGPGNDIVTTLNLLVRQDGAHVYDITSKKPSVFFVLP